MADRITLTRNPRGRAILATNHYPHPSFSATGTQVQLSNYVNNSRCSTTAGFAAGFGTGGAGTAAIINNGGPGAVGNSYRMTWTTAGAVGTSNLELQAGQVIGAGIVCASVYVRCSKAQRLQLASVGTNVSATSSSVVVPATTWTRLSAIVTLSGTGMPLLRVLGATGTGALAWAAGDWLETGCYAITQSDAPLDWWDGSSPAAGPYTYGWQGAVGASWSNRFAPGLMAIPSNGPNDTLTERGDQTGHTNHGAYSVQATQLRTNAGGGIDFAGLSIGTYGIEQGKTYNVSVQVWIPSGLPDPYLWVVGSGLDVQPRSASTPLKDQWALLSLPFTLNQASGGSVLPRIRFETPLAAGSKFWADSMMLNDGANRQSYFDGEYSPDSAGNTYAWDGDVDNSISTQTGDDPHTVVQPKLLLGYKSARTSQNRIHRVIGSDFPAVTLRAATRRAGTLEFLFDNEDDARWCERAHGGSGVWAYVDVDHTAANMNYVVSEGGRIALEQQEQRSTWVLTVDFEQVAY